MDIWDKLIAVTILAQDEEDLPDFLAERIFALVELTRNCKDVIRDINDLTEKVAQYDTFAQTGYIGMGVDNLILEESIKRFENKANKFHKE